MVLFEKLRSGSSIFEILWFMPLSLNSSVPFAKSGSLRLNNEHDFISSTRTDEKIPTTNLRT